MALFRCSQCGCVENTACCNYWVDVHYMDRPPLCSACDPALGRWHGRFARTSAEGLRVGQNGLLVDQAVVTQAAQQPVPLQ